MKGPTIGIIGGNGRMGRTFARLFEEAGLGPPLISDLDTPLSPVELARRCDVVVVSVPMEAFPGLVAQIGPAMGEGAFLTDLCSLKQRQVEAMLANTSCEVAGTHPLFGPHEEGFRGLRAALCPGRGNRWLQWWEGVLRSVGIKTCVVEAHRHDETMAWVQVLNHFLLMALGKALEHDGIPLDRLLALATPSFERQLRIVARLALQDPELYATIQLSNPYTHRVLSTFRQEEEGLFQVVEAGDREAFLEIFKEVQGLGRELNRVFTREGGE